jgi:hypothetical protein
MELSQDLLGNVSLYKRYIIPKNVNNKKQATHKCDLFITLASLPLSVMALLLYLCEFVKQTQQKYLAGRIMVGRHRI